MNLLFVNARRLFLPFGLLTALLSVIGCASSAPPSSSTDTPASKVMMANAATGGQPSSQTIDLSPEGDRIRVGDPITISFSGVTVVDAPPMVNERIKSDGMLRLPMIADPIRAEGKTRGELEDEIHKLYVPKLFKTLTVKVGSEGRTVYVGGEVRIQGRVQYMGEMTVLQAVASAGGFTDFAKRKRVEITRANARKVTVDCVKAQRDPKYDVRVYPDDRIEVPRRLW